jgi:acetyl esterase/lipase
MSPVNQSAINCDFGMKWLLYLTVAAMAFFSAQPAISAEKDVVRAEVIIITNIPYKTGIDLSAYEQETCKLDLYLPVAQTNFATLVWFHGGGLEGGDKRGDGAVARSLAQAGVAVVSANYRLSPMAKYPAYLQDAAAAVAWTHAHITQRGGDPDRLFVGGHSAGGWLALMIGLDETYLRQCGLRPSGLAGLIPVSGQTMTHYTVRKERGVGQFTIIADEAAPVHYARQKTPPMLVLYADHDMAARAEENEYFVALMKGAGNEHVAGRLIPNRDHVSIADKIANEGDPTKVAIIDFIQSPLAAHPRALGQAPVLPASP